VAFEAYSCMPIIMSVYASLLSDDDLCVHVHRAPGSNRLLLLLLLLQEMLCIEPAVAGSGPYKLAPGQTWSGSQTLVYKAG
jgi:hypothetical protein